MNWDDIQKVEIIRGQFNDKIIIRDDDDKFSIDLFGEVAMNGKVKDSVGFEKGEEILETILVRTGLGETEIKTAMGYYYYSRD